MTIRTVLRLGEPLLNQCSEAVIDPGSAETSRIIEDMFDTMKHYQGVGLAAPQIGVLKRIVIFGFKDNERYPDQPPVPETILINPVIKVLDSSCESDWEGCLSIPGMRGRVSRPVRIQYTGLTPQGEMIDREVEGFHARVVQHECDHLDGILYVQRLDDMREFGFQDELDANHRYDTPPPCDS